MNRVLDKLLYVFYAVVAIVGVAVVFYFYNNQYAFKILDKNITMLVDDKYTVGIYPNNLNFNEDNYNIKLSNDNLVADNLTLTAVSEGTTIVTIKSKKGFNTAKIKVTILNTKIASLVVPEKLTLEVDTVKKLDVLINGDNSIKSNLIYTSSNPEIASVDEYGNITGLSIGTTSIKVLYSDDIFAYTNVEVIDKKVELKDINVPENIKLSVGETKPIDVTYFPEDVTNKSVVLKSENEQIAKVINDKVVGVGKGTTSVIVTSGNIKKKIKVEVKEDIKDKSLEKYSINLSVNKKELNVSDTATLTCYITSNKGLYEECSDYELSKKNIIKIDNNKITALKDGNVTISVAKYGQSASISLTVKNKIVEPTDIKLSNSQVSLLVGGVHKLTATVLPENANNKNVTWSSSNMNIVTVSNGEVVGINEGTATIVATTSNGKKATASVVVTKKTPTPTPTPTATPKVTAIPTPTPTATPKVTSTPKPTATPVTKRTVDLIRGSLYNNGFLHYYERGNSSYEYNNQVTNNCNNADSIQNQYFTLYPANNMPTFKECHYEGDTKVYTAEVNGNNDKLVKVTPSNEVQLDIVTYNKSYSASGNDWPHLLISGRTGLNGLGVLSHFEGRLQDGMTGLTPADKSFFYFNNDKQINLSLDVKLNSYNKGNPINGVSAFQYLIYLELYCDNACGNNQVAYWLGFNLFDDRGACYESNQGSVHIDEKTGMLTVLLPSKTIYTNGTLYNGGNFAMNQWKHVQINLSERINELLNQIHLSGKTNVKASDLRYGGFNIGYEVHGEYWVSASFKNLSLTSTQK